MVCNRMATMIESVLPATKASAPCRQVMGHPSLRPAQARTTNVGNAAPSTNKGGKRSSVAISKLITRFPNPRTNAKTSRKEIIEGSLSDDERRLRIEPNPWNSAREPQTRPMNIPAICPSWGPRISPPRNNGRPRKLTVVTTPARSSNPPTSTATYAQNLLGCLSSFIIVPLKISQFHPTPQAHDWLPGLHREDLRARHVSREPQPQLVCPGRADVSLVQGRI